MIDDTNDGWERCIIMRPKKPFDTTTVTASAVTTLCDNPLFDIIYDSSPDISDVAFEDLKVKDMLFFHNHVKHSRTPEPPR